MTIHQLSTLFLILMMYCTGLTQENFTITGRLYTDHAPVSIQIRAGKIASIQKIPEEEAPNIFIAPGLVEIQINGYYGTDFSGPDLTIEKVMKATKELWKAGVTTYFPTIITSDVALMKKNFSVLAKAKLKSTVLGSIAGFHLEGPYISPLPGFRGAHLEKYIKNPDWEEFQTIQHAADQQIKLITVAPELEGAIPFIQQCVQEGLVVSLGHHNGSVEDIDRAVFAGARMVTHLGNGCANEIHRHHNPLWPQLSNDLLTPSLIVDGYHLTREEVRTFYKTKGPDRTILVSDALDLAGLPPGKYIRGERTLVLTPNVVQLPKENVLAGAASPISKCVAVMMEYTQCSLKEAIQMASTNPAKMFQLSDRGQLTPGSRADIILFKLGPNQLDIQKTYVKGQLVFDSQK